MIVFFLFLFFHLSSSASHPQHRVEIIAHRGASAYAPENTIAAFKKAIELGATILELDVHQTKDSHLVVIHDGSVNRTTNGNGKIKNLALAEIKKLDAGNWFSPVFANERIPTLDEVFDITPDSVRLLIELKSGSDEYPGIENRLIGLIRERNMQHRVILKSFDDRVLEYLRRFAPDIPRLKIIIMQFFGIIIEHGLNFGTILDDDVQYLQHHWFWLTEHFIQKAHQHGYKIFVWDVNTKEHMKEFIEKGIDGIETNHPDILRQLLHNMKRE